ncbi:MAG: proprotein convertase P-domain-containing protein [Acidobacteria bacterium]|nr:proprotein convertase P-domain-containing protein [Acidobacteriota bacterium]
MAMRIGNDSSVNQLQQTTSNSSTSRATQQPSVRENSAFQGDQLRAGTDSRATMRSSENLAASNLRSQAQTAAPSLKQITDNAASAVRPATTGRDEATPVTKSVSPNAAIRDNSTTTSTINFANEGQVQNLSVNVNIAHTYRGDLVVKLVSPSGKEAVLTNKAGGSADNFVLSAKDLSTTFANESIKGDWKLVVQDTAKQDVGTLKSWGMTITPKDATTPPPPQTGPTLLQVTGDANFRSVVARDLAKFAPGTTVDAQGYVRAATTRTPGHEQGYKLLDDILAGGKGGNKKVNISFTSQNAFTQSGAGATTGAGSDATVAMDFGLRISLPALQPDGTIKDEPIASEVILAHELAHASHAQNGTIDRSLRDHTFTDGGTTYKENWRYEEFRTTGFTGFRQGNEPSENSIRAELGYNARATYLDRSSWTRVNGATNNGITANAPTNGNEQLVGDSWRSAGAALPNGQFRICDCFAC